MRCPRAKEQLAASFVPLFLLLLLFTTPSLSAKVCTSPVPATSAGLQSCFPRETPVSCNQNNPIFIIPGSTQFPYWCGGECTSGLVPVTTTGVCSNRVTTCFICIPSNCAAVSPTSYFTCVACNPGYELTSGACADLCTYTPEASLFWSTTTSDLPNQPMTGTVATCRAACSASFICLGFSWNSTVATTSTGSCWLKQTLDGKSTTNNIGTYVTYVKGGCSSSSSSSSILPIAVSVALDGFLLLLLALFLILRRRRKALTTTASPTSTTTSTTIYASYTPDPRHLPPPSCSSSSTTSSTPPVWVTIV